MTQRHFRTADRLVIGLDALLNGGRHTPSSGRPSPSLKLPFVVLPDDSRERSARLMRVNHTGEVCAQALYLAQGLLARTESTRKLMDHAAREEQDHLNWCAERMVELESHPSRLDGLWFAGAYVIGLASALAGDRWSLGFLEETERQVVEHLEDHLGKLPRSDHRSRAILTQMSRDEAGHAKNAVRHGAAKLPLPARLLMRVQAFVMKKVSARI